MKFFNNFCMILLLIDWFAFSNPDNTIDYWFQGVKTNCPVNSLVFEIAELNNRNVHIRDRDRVESILKTIIQGGPKQLQIVSDFDRTITKQHEEGNTEMTTISSFSLFSHCPSVPKQYLITVQSLFQKYFPYEIDVSIPEEEKRKLMEEWWSHLENALNGITVSQEEIQATAEKCEIYLRDGTEKLFEGLNKYGIPVLVFSAGLGDTVVAALKRFNILYPNVKVVSNFLKYDNHGVIQGFKSSAIHILNKNELALEETEYYGLIKNRDNVVLMGDSLGDSGMADGVHHVNAILKIGFLYGNVQKNLPVFMIKFDIVLEDDQTMDVIRAILKKFL